MIISVNKVIEKGAKRVEVYLRIRGVIQLKQFRSVGLLPFFLGGGSPGGLLGIPGFLWSLMIILFLPKFVISL